MTDYFQLLGLPRRPWLDPEAVRASFLALSSEAHPDRRAKDESGTVSHDHFAELNAASACLKSPKERLRHLLELESGTPLAQLDRVATSSGDLFFQIGQLCREVDKFLGERARAGSPLLRARYFKESLAWSEKLTKIRQQLELQATSLEKDMKELNPAWENASDQAERQAALPLAHLEKIYREYSFAARWLSQVRERIVQLAM